MTDHLIVADLDRVNIVRHQRDTAPRLHQYHAVLHHLGVTGRGAVVQAPIQIVMLAAFDCGDAGPGRVIVDGRAVAAAHDVQIQRVAAIGILADQIARVAHPRFRRRVILLAP